MADHTSRRWRTPCSCRRRHAFGVVGVFVALALCLNIVVLDFFNIDASLGQSSEPAVRVRQQKQQQQQQRGSSSSRSNSRSAAVRRGLEGDRDNDFATAPAPGTPSEAQSGEDHKQHQRQLAKAGEAAAASVGVSTATKPKPGVRHPTATLPLLFSGGGSGSADGLARGRGHGATAVEEVLDAKRRELASATTGLCFENISALDSFVLYDADVGYFKVNASTNVLSVPPFVKDWFSNEKTSAANVSVVLNTQQDATACLVDNAFVPYCGPCASTSAGDVLAVSARDQVHGEYQLPLTVATCVVFVSNSFIQSVPDGMDGTCETFCTSNGHSCYRGYRRTARASVPVADLNSQSAGDVTTCRAGSIPDAMFSCNTSTGSSCLTHGDCFDLTGTMEACVAGTCECPTGFCWDLSNGRCVLQQYSVVENAVSAVTCERDSQQPCALECDDPNMTCLPVTSAAVNVSGDFVGATTCQCSSGLCFDDSTGACFSPPQPAAFLDPVVDCSFAFDAAAATAADSGNAVCHCEARQCLKPNNMTGCVHAWVRVRLCVVPEYR